ncbi:hypothetical protein MEPL4_3c02150 [Melissococcus plutonius]|uniref:FeoB-associated Cys-rich membrane protein n=1 Tax=Melissococcus plutonius TaxID=33970 RepID=UPI00065F3892|nr:FeoB-associated Cys-rich membrane protein [Melissococcus plutonius]AIM25631.1 hypothetical protein MEPL_c004760 [Melissococcus plutonius S1]KMT24697.1 hypothetical protein MEPL2_2c02230 [Melissococcus plutonius]KMT27411.1 hypothetical protein MEPL3_1c05050 [Melissococcus plutonius]KMT27584.1 hypothetical protein MEPL1_3c02160 [Melissococcus plutonius]KMT29357.1 hypothetical protein MEPL4_3c02150 [Melissococcus plutonius]
MATWILGIIIFGAAGYATYSFFKKGGCCEDCSDNSCPVKKPETEKVHNCHCNKS